MIPFSTRKKETKRETEMPAGEHPNNTRNTRTVRVFRVLRTYTRTGGCIRHPCPSGCMFVADRPGVVCSMRRPGVRPQETGIEPGSIRERHHHHHSIGQPV